MLDSMFNTGGLQKEIGLPKLPKLEKYKKNYGK